jgi:hypothetical protein
MTNPNDSATGFAWSQEQQGTSGLSKREYLQQWLCRDYWLVVITFVITNF